MNEAFEIQGRWWLPETHEVQVPGILSFSPGNVLRLKLMGAFNKPKEEKSQLPNFFIPEIILGISSKGESVTLYDCILEGESSSSGVHGSFSQTEFIANVAFLGFHFPARENIQFSSLCVRFHNLDNWYNKAYIQSVKSDTKGGAITYSYPAPMDIQLKEFLVQFVVNLLNKNALNSVSVKAETWVVLSSEPKKSIEAYFEILRLIQNFLTLAITQPTFVIEMIGNLTNKIGPTDGDFTGPPKIRIYYAAFGWQSDAREIFWTRMFLPLSKIENNLPNLIRAWVEKSDKLKSVYDLYFAGYYRSMYSEDKFLNLTQALETYHRSIYGGQFEKEDVFLKGTYKKLVEAIPQNLSEDFKDSLRGGKLRYAHEYSFRKRILLLTNHILENMPVGFLSETKERNNFAKRIADTRNYLTHHSPELAEIAITSTKGLFLLITQLRLIMKICLLEELGIPFNIINTFLKDDRDQQYLAQQQASE